MKPNSLTALAALTASLLVAGCTATKVVSSESELRAGERFARPERILVYDFAASSADLAPGSSLATHVAEPESPPSAEQLELGRRLGGSVAEALVEEIRALGLPGQLARASAPPNPGDLVIQGAFGSFDEGSAIKRVLLGFGSGAAQLHTFVEGHVMTETGLRRLGSREVRSGASRTPGVVLPVLVTIATANPIGILVSGTVKGAQELTGRQSLEAEGQRTAARLAKELEPRFREQGWID